MTRATSHTDHPPARTAEKRRGRPPAGAQPAIPAPTTTPPGPGRCRTCMKGHRLFKPQIQAHAARRHGRRPAGGVPDDHRREPTGIDCLQRGAGPAATSCWPRAARPARLTLGCVVDMPSAAAVMAGRPDGARRAAAGRGYRGPDPLHAGPCAGPHRRREAAGEPRRAAAGAAAFWSRRRRTWDAGVSHAASPWPPSAPCRRI